MYSVAVNLRSPREWRLKVQKFISRLEDSFKDRLVSVIALPSPEDSLYDSNVLVMLDKLKQGDLREVASLAPDEVSPLVVPKEDREAVEAFLNYEKTSITEDEWLSRIKQFANSLEDSFKNRLVSVIALPSPEDSLYDSNVLVMLDKLKQGDLREVASLAPDEVSPLVVPKEDREAVEAFFLRGGTRVAGSEVKIR